MSKENLAEVKRQFFEQGELSICGFEYLLTQAEEKIQLEERVKVLERIEHELEIHINTIETQNQRYKQALESVYSIIQLAHLEENSSEQALKQIENLVIDSWVQEVDANG